MGEWMDILITASKQVDSIYNQYYNVHETCPPNTRQTLIYSPKKKIVLKVNADPSGAPEFIQVFSGVCVLLDLWFYVYVLQIVVCPFVIFHLAIVLSVLLRFTDSDYPLVSSNFSYWVVFLLCLSSSCVYPILPVSLECLFLIPPFGVF